MFSSPFPNLAWSATIPGKKLFPMLNKAPIGANFTCTVGLRAYLATSFSGKPCKTFFIYIYLAWPLKRGTACFSLLYIEAQLAIDQDYGAGHPDIQEALLLRHQPPSSVRQK